MLFIARMTLPTIVYSTISKFYSPAFSAHQSAAAAVGTVAHSLLQSDEERAEAAARLNGTAAPGAVVIHDVMTTLEPSNSERGAMTVADKKEFEQRCGRAPTKEEAEGGPLQSWRDYVDKRVGKIRDVASLEAVQIYVAVFDRRTHDMKHVEHAHRYGKAEQRAAAAVSEAAVAAATSETSVFEVEGENDDVISAAAEALAEAAKEAEPSVEEVDAAFEAATIPRNWRRFRASRYFTKRLACLIADGIEALAATLETAISIRVVDGRETRRQIAKHIVIVGDPRLPLEQSHVALRLRQRKNSEKNIVIEKTKIEDDALVADYAEADFAVVMFAVHYVREGRHVVVRAVDGDSLLSLLLAVPRTAHSLGSLAMMRELPSGTTLVDVRALRREILRDEMAHAPEMRCVAPIETVVMLCMLSGNDYALNVLPGVSFERYHRFYLERAAEWGVLVTATPERELETRPDEPHAISVDHDLFVRFIGAINDAYKIKAEKRVEPAQLDVAWAVLNFTLNYFANASNALVVQESCFRRVGAGAGISVHGFELVSRGEPPSRTNVRLADRVYVPL